MVNLNVFDLHLIVLSKQLFSFFDVLKNQSVVFSISMSSRTSNHITMCRLKHCSNNGSMAHANG